MQIQDVFGEPIYTYSRTMAIEDGIQTLLKNKYASMAKEAGWKHPVYLTSNVMTLIKKAITNKKYLNDFEGVLWDILWMGTHGPGRMIDESTKEYKVIITGTGKKKYHTLYAQCGPVDYDNPDPAITIMLSEDM